MCARGARSRPAPGPPPAPARGPAAQPAPPLRSADRRRLRDPDGRCAPPTCAATSLPCVEGRRSGGENAWEPRTGAGEPGWGSAWLGAAPVLTEARQPGPSAGLGRDREARGAMQGPRESVWGHGWSDGRAVMARPRWAPWGTFSVGVSQLLYCLIHSRSSM